MRVGVNLAWLVPGVVGGSEEATLGALRAVDDLRDPTSASERPEVVVFGSPALFEAHPDLRDRFEHHVVGAGANRVRRVVVESTELVTALRSARIDVVHHAGGVLPFRSPHPAVVAIHDIQPLDLPEHFGAVKRRYLGAQLPRSVRRADAITVPSRFVARRLVERLGVPEARITVVPWSVPVRPAPDAAARAAVRERFGLTGHIVLYPAIPYAHKNHAVLVDAVGRLPGVDLVLPGAPGPLDADLAARAGVAGLRTRVHRLGRIPADQLAALMAEAAVVAVPSRYEGFGLPALEALAAGRALVVSSSGSLPEVVGDAALVVDPDDVAGWTAAISRLISDPTERRRLEAAGPAVAATYSPEWTAAALVDVWQRGASPTPPPAAPAAPTSWTPS